MNIRKHWKKLLLTTTAFFWASCTSENEAVFPTIGQDEPPAIHPEVSSDSNGESVVESSSSVNEAETSSSETASEISSSETAPEISSSEAAASSSSVVESSSSSSLEKVQSSSSVELPTPYRLAYDTSVTCRVETQQIQVSLGSNPTELMDKLKNNKTRTIEELDRMEEDLERAVENYGALYGVSFATMAKRSFKCSDGYTYEGESHVVKDSVIYTYDDFYEKYPSERPSPYCQKDDFVSNGTFFLSGPDKQAVGEIKDKYNDAKIVMIDSVKNAKGGGLSDSQNACLDSNVQIIPTGSEFVATKQICDGDTIVNPRYQAKLDSNKAFINRQIDKCLNE